MSETSKVGRSSRDLSLPQPDALALEYQGEYGSAFRDFSIADIVNNPNASGVVRVFGPGFLEQTTDLPLFQARSLSNDGADALLVRQHRKKPLA